MRRKISLTVLIAFIVSMVALNHGCSGSSSEEVEERFDSLSFDVNSPALKQKLGEDDGYALAIHYGADIHGSLETCG